MSASEQNAGIGDVYERHAEFVWSSLHRLGVRDSDLPDLTQEVFLVAHRRFESWDRQCKVTTWLFGICRKVASSYRRRAWFRRERPVGRPTPIEDHRTPEGALVVTEAQARLARVLEKMTPDRRALFVMYELEERSCAEIAEVFAIPVGTVHSRLHKARAEFRRHLHRLDKRSDKTQAKGGRR